MSRHPAPYKRPYFAADADATRASGIEDIAFADTVVAADLDEAVPPSGIVVNDERGRAHRMIPVAFPLPVASGNLGMRTRVRLAFVRMRRGVKASRGEIHRLWRATATVDESQTPFARPATIGRRLRTLFSFFEWDRGDVLRAAWIGLAVVAFAATAGAIVLQRGSAPELPQAPREVPREAPREAPSRAHLPR